MLHDVTEMRHPPLETTVRHGAQTRNIIDTISTSSILLLAISSVQDDVQLDSVEIGKGGNSAFDNGLVEIALDVVLQWTRRK